MDIEIFKKIMFYVVLLFAITLHEWAHAWTAERCGDDTPRLMGRITLNPLAHITLVGTVIIPLVMIFTAPGFGLIGWGKPVMINPRNFRNYVRDDMLVSLAGVFTNLITMLVALILIRILSLIPGEMTVIATYSFLLPLAQISFILAFFNLLPIPPLDGSHILRHLLGPGARQTFDKIAPYGFFILIIFVNIGVLSPIFNLLIKVYSILVKLMAGI